MSKCTVCNTSVSVFRRFLINPDADVYLKCINCGSELIDKSKYFNHVMVTAFVFLVAIFSINYFHFNDLVEYSVSFFGVILYYIIFLPFLKR